MRRPAITAMAAAGASMVLAAAGWAAMMHPELGARLSGMGYHGVVNLQLTQSSGKLCWTFDVPATMGATAASVHTGQTGAKLLELGMHYTKSGCETESMMTLEHLEAKPASYWVWVDTRAHMGELRGTLGGCSWEGVAAIYMCTMPATSAPRTSPMWALVSTHTQ